VDVVPRYRFERLVADALDDLPGELAAVLDNMVVVVGPDVVSIYRLALCAMCADENDLADEVYVTVVHELAHAAGIDDERLHELGWG